MLPALKIVGTHDDGSFSYPMNFSTKAPKIVGTHNDGSSSYLMSFLPKVLIAVPRGMKNSRFFDNAAVETQEDKIKDTVDPWRLCTVTQVDELKSIIRLLPIWANDIVFSTVYSRMGTMFVLQGNTLEPYMGPRFKISSTSPATFDTDSVIAWVPVLMKK